MKKGIREFLTEHAKAGPVSFHMPGHKGRPIAGFSSVRTDWDITEIHGADNLFQPESVIRTTMEKYEKLYGAKRSYLLVNGSSAGIMAAMLTAVSRGGKVIMARNCHKSVFNALTLANLKPVYAFPEREESFEITGAVSPSEIAGCLWENPDAEAVILPSPNYYGVCSDIKAIASEVHSRGKILIVDQAHGAHLKFFGGGKFPEAAEDLGADIVINSTHKTLASFTQTAVLNVCSDRVDLALLEDRLQTLESSSPSYPLMATLDMNADLLLERGPELIEGWRSDLDWFYRRASEISGLKVMECEGLDRSKLNLDMSACGLDGSRLEEELRKEGIFVELTSGNMAMCMTGIGNVRTDYERLAAVLERLSGERRPAQGEREKPAAPAKPLRLCGIPAAREAVSLDEAAGRVCAMAVIPYPPGIPVVCPGEVIDEEAASYISEMRKAGEKVIGVTPDLKVWVGRR